MLENTINDLKLLEHTFFYNLDITLGLIILLFSVYFINRLLGNRLCYLGIVPRNLFGLIGIVCSPFLHGNFNHLFFNSIPLFCLANMVLVYGFNVFIAVSFIIVILSGLLIWLFGRYSIHLGASALIMGYFGFLMTNAYVDPNSISLILIVLCLYYFGGLVAALIPTDSDGISVEGHIFGFLSGIFAYYYWPNALFLIQV